MPIWYVILLFWNGRELVPSDKHPPAFEDKTSAMKFARRECVEGDFVKIATSESGDGGDLRRKQFGNLLVA